MGARFSAPVQTGPGAHPASCTMGTGSFPGVKSGRGVTLTSHPLLVPRSRKGRAIPLLPLWAVRPVQSLSACTRVHFTLPQCLRVHFTFTVFIPPMARESLACQGLHIIEASRPHSDRHTIPGRTPLQGISPTQRPLLDVIRTHYPIKQAPADPCLRPRGHCDW